MLKKGLVVNRANWKSWNPNVWWLSSSTTHVWRVSMVQSPFRYLFSSPHYQFPILSRVVIVLAWNIIQPPYFLDKTDQPHDNPIQKPMKLKIFQTNCQKPDIPQIRYSYHITIFPAFSQHFSCFNPHLVTTSQGFEAAELTEVKDLAMRMRLELPPGSRIFGPSLVVALFWVPQKNSAELAEFMMVCLF